MKLAFLNVSPALTVSVGLLRAPQQLVSVRSKRPCNHQVFRDIEPSLSALVLRDERLGPPQLHCQLRLRDPAFFRASTRRPKVLS